MESFNQETLARISKNDPTLRVLRISDIATPNPNHGEVGMYVPTTSDNDDNDTEFPKLGIAMGNNIHLESVCFDGDMLGLLDDEMTRAVFSTDIKRNTSISRLSLCRCNLSVGGKGREVLKIFEGNINLNRISFQRCVMGDGGIHALVGILNTCKNIKRVRIKGARGTLRLRGGLLLNHILDESIEELVSALRGHAKLEELDLGHNDILGSASCQALADLLKEPECNLVTLRLENNLIDVGSASAFAEALRINAKLKNLFLHGNPIYSVGLEELFSTTLCNTSSIDDTYYSNHTLQSFVSFRNWVVPSYLELNRSSSDKRQVAIQKILRHHRHFDMKPLFAWDLKMLPVVIEWFETARKCSENMVDIDRRQLSAIYQFALDMPIHFLLELAQLPERRLVRKQD